MTKNGTHRLKPKARSDLHLMRKAWHIVSVGTMFAIYRMTPTWVSLVSLATGTLLFVSLDLLRQRHPALNAKLVRWFGWIIRDYEMNGLAGTTYLLLGTWIVYLVFPRPIIELSLLFLAIGDPVASLCGIWFGRDKILGHKTLQGFLGAFVVCSILALGYFYAENLMVERLLIVSAAAGFAAALSELLPVKHLDDNLTFPILCASQLYFLFSLFGGFSV